VDVPRSAPILAVKMNDCVAAISNVLRDAAAFGDAKIAATLGYKSGHRPYRTSVANFVEPLVFDDGLPCFRGARIHSSPPIE
jgi:hypothetical protein